MHSACPITGSAIQLVVIPGGIASASPDDHHVSFPSPAATDPADITGSFCCHVAFLAGAGAARTWRETYAGVTLNLDAAYELGRRAVTPLLTEQART